MFPPLPQEQAYSYCKKILGDLRDGSLRLSEPRNHATDRACQGITLGTLTCKNSDGEFLVLLAVSGVTRQLIPDSGTPGHDVFSCGQEYTFSTGEKAVIVPPIVSPRQIEAALKKNDAEIHRLTNLINEQKKIRADGRTPGSLETELSARRRTLTTDSLSAVHSLYEFTCIDRTRHSLKEICSERGRDFLPPTGTGECCAPKLFDYAFSHNLTPLSLCEVRHNFSAETDGGTSPEPLSPCDERCGIILPSVLGLNILYRDQNIVVVNKPGGLLSVPGRGPLKKDSVETRVRILFPECIEQPAVHRLDMETSGLMVLALDKESHRALRIQFERGEITKEYAALLDGIAEKKGIAPHGITELYFRLDVENRPHQIWDAENGKRAVTEWQIERTQSYIPPSGKKRAVTRITFFPHTGRTHQLRLASADAHGLGIPIVGDTLYGKCESGERLMLHSQRISFKHPRTGESMTFFCPAPF